LVHFSLKYDNGDNNFPATVSKTVRPMLSDRSLSCLSVTLVYCGQKVGWIKVKLGTQVGLGRGHIVLYGVKRGTAPNIRRICYSQMTGWIKMPLRVEVGLRPGDFVLDGDPASPPQKGGRPQFSTHVYCGQTLGGSRWHLAWRWASVQATLC